MRYLACLMLLLMMAACSTSKELATVRDSDPTWALIPDHISAADLPR
jgi:hypothetical protein